jgi:hypothetical protein
MRRMSLCRYEANVRGSRSAALGHGDLPEGRWYQTTTSSMPGGSGGELAWRQALALARLSRSIFFPFSFQKVFIQNLPLKLSVKIFQKCCSCFGHSKNLFRKFSSKNSFLIFPFSKTFSSDILFKMFNNFSLSLFFYSFFKTNF